MNYSEMKGRTIAWDFAEFDKRNPRIYQLFCTFAMQAISLKKKTSAKLIINRIRWEIYIVSNSNDQFKINDAFSAHYGRKFVTEFPQYKEYFEFRSLRSL